MSNTLATLRQGLSTALEVGAGLRVTDHLPERISPPLVMIAAGSPYLESGNTFGSFNVRFTLVLVCATGPNDVTTKALDDVVTRAVVALFDGAFRIERVDQPTMLAHSNTHYLSTTVDVLATVPGLDDGRP